MKLAPVRIACLALSAAITAGLADAAVTPEVPTLPSRPIAMQDASSAATTVEGRLHVFASDDFEHHRASTLYFIEEARTLKLYRVRLSHVPRKVGRSGRHVSLSGVLSGESLTLDAAGTQSLDAALEDTAIESKSFAAAAQTRRAIVMVASFQDAGAECLVGAINNTLFGALNGFSVDNLYKEASLGQLGFTGNVVGPYAIADTASGKCDMAGWASALDAKAAAAGVDLSQYQNKVYVLPSKSSCSIGIGSIGGSPGVAYISRCGMPDVYAHELGHNLALNHASTAADQYGDTSDIMGYSGLTMRGLNAPHLQQLGWRDASKVRSVTTTGTYDVAPLQLGAAQAVTSQMLRIAIPGTGEEYYVSYRQPTGLDALLPLSYQGLAVHRFANTGGRTYLMGTYGNGQSFVDAANDITITAVSRTSGYYTVQVELGFAPADTQAPSAPGGTTATPNKRKQTITIAWSAATDNVGVTSYRVYRDGVKIGSTAGTSYVDRAVPDTARHTYAVKAYDAAGNRSAFGERVRAALGP